MPTIHYFQRYSKREDVITNNTLLLLTRLNEISREKFQAVLTELVKEEIEVGVSIIQQARREGEGSVPDGLIRQRSFQIVIETKLGDEFPENQLLSHLSSFGNAEKNFLIALGKGMPSEQLLEKVRRAANDAGGKKIQVIGTNFAALIEIVESVIDEHEWEMRRLLEDYQQFCDDEGLLPNDEYLMRLVLANKTREENLKFNIYYDRRGFRGHKYIGLYGNKTIYAVGEIENIIRADILNGDLEESKATEEQRKRIREIVRYAMDDKGWDISKDHYFFCVKEFIPTDFKKDTPRPPMGTKFFNLKKLLNKDPLPSATEIAELLKGMTWNEQTT